MKTFVLLLATAFAGQAAVAQTAAPIRVTMAAPVAQNGQVKALATTWNCTGTLCIGPEINGRFGEARACREVAKAVGAVAAYTGPRGEMDAAALATCNKSAKKAG